MTPVPLPPDPSVFRELKRRRVGRVVVAYLALSFGALALGRLLLLQLGGPEWGFRALLGTIAMGFPFTSVLAWTYDITPHGIVRTPEDPTAAEPEDPAPRWAWAATVATGLLVGLVASVLDLWVF